MFDPALPARLRFVWRFTRAATFAVLFVGRAPPLQAQVVTRVSISSAGAQANADTDYAAISADGGTVVFVSASSSLGAGGVGGNWQIFVHDRTTGSTECVSVSTSGQVGNGYSYQPAISDDGTVVAFASDATNLVNGDTNGFADVFVHDRVTGITQRVSVPGTGSPPDGDCRAPSISSDGRHVAYESRASNLVIGDKNGAFDVFVYDRVARTTERVSVDSNGKEAFGNSTDATISADGDVVAFVSDAVNLVSGDTDRCEDAFVHVRSTAVTERVSVSTTGAQPDYDCWEAALSADGNVVAFTTQSTTLVAGDTNFTYDVFVHDRSAGTTERVSLSASGAELDRDSEFPSLSLDGSVVTFTSAATNVDPADTNGVADLFLRDRGAGTTTLVSLDCAWAAGNGMSRLGSVSDDGKRVAFSSEATDLVSGDTNGFRDVFVNDFTAPPVAATWSNYGAGYPGTLGVPSLTASAAPVFATTFTIDVGNSLGHWSVADLLIGINAASIPTSAGGTLLVDPALSLLVTLLPSGASLPEYVPRDPELCGLTLYLQALELDPGAAKGISFTPGLQWVVGH